MVHVPSSVDRREMDRYRLLVEQTMLAATEAAEGWCAGSKPEVQWPGLSAAAA
jgi:hypothetical protein